MFKKFLKKKNLILFKNVQLQNMSSIIKKNELEKLIKEKGKYVLIDVRTTEEINSGIIETAKTMAIDDKSKLSEIVESNFKLNEKEFKEKFNFEKPKKNETLIFYCRSGARAQLATDAIEKLGYNSVINYKGSAMEWFGN
jgi:rhodanese-related sulfurtransferase